MRKLRKITGGLSGFLYKIEVIELLPHGKTNSFDDTINCSHTSMRAGKFAYEYYNRTHDVWENVDDVRYFSILNNHKTKSVIRRKGVEKPKARTLNDIFEISEHFLERLYQRFVTHENAVPGVLDYIIENGYYIKEGEFPKYMEKKAEKDDRFYVYEKDLRMFMVCDLNTEIKKIRLITTYDPTEKWFKKWEQDQRLKEQIPMKKFIKEMR
tara:strand:- start:22473 stop:23105 length:633 start_codon:yes stop_codon:yes gene_type:complete